MNEEIRKIYELETLLKQAETTIQQLKGAVNALKPKQSSKKRMTKAEAVNLFQDSCRKQKKPTQHRSVDLAGSPTN